MATLYSVYEAKARFSEMIRQVRAGGTITISYRGKPVAEIRAVRKSASIEERLEELRRQGTLMRSRETRRPLRPGAPAPGALDRFLAERNK